MYKEALAGILGTVGVIANINTVDIALGYIFIFIATFSYIVRLHDRRA